MLNRVKDISRVLQACSKGVFESFNVCFKNIQVSYVLNVAVLNSGEESNSITTVCKFLWTKMKKNCYIFCMACMTVYMEIFRGFPQFCP